MPFRWYTTNRFVIFFFILNGVRKEISECLVVLFRCVITLHLTILSYLKAFYVCVCALIRLNLSFSAIIIFRHFPVHEFGVRVAAFFPVNDYKNDNVYTWEEDDTLSGNNLE